MSRFVSVTKSEMDDLIDKKDSVNTKHVISSAVRVFASFCAEKNLCFGGVSNEVLASVLQKFYAGARTQTGELYSKKSLLSIRYGLQKHFENTVNVDIVNCEDFKCANKVFHAMLVKLKAEGKSVVQHKSPLSKEDLNKLYDSFDLQKPKDLQNKVFVDFMLFFCNRGRENLREVTKGHFTVHEQEGYIELRDMATKNHRGTAKDTESQGGRIYRIRDDGDLSCPFASFVKYLSVLNSECELFFQRAKKTVSNDVWFDNMVLGKNALGDKMKVLSVEARLSKIYTNHCLRATSINLLNGYEARHVMAVSGHKSETSIRSYARTDDRQKQKMAMTIAEAVTGTASSAAATPGAPPVYLPPGRSTTQSAAPAPPPVYCPDRNIAQGGTRLWASAPPEPSRSLPVRTAYPDFTLDTEFLELTASQETRLRVDVQDVINRENQCPNVQPLAPTNQHHELCQISVVPGSSSEMNVLPGTSSATFVHSVQQIQEISRSAPVYYFPNSVVHIHQH